MIPNNKPLNGIVLVNKPNGLTSNAVLQRVKRLYQVKKAGHTGSLDPLATGMLPICFGEATKWSQYLLEADKCYEVTGLLGIKTSTADATGQVIAESNVGNISTQTLLQVLADFQGCLQQVPTMYSALKHNGVPLYKYARAGIEIHREPRTINIHHLELTSFDGKYFQLKVICSKGTYIRNLIEDIGDQLLVGAHVTQLHRCYTGGFENDPMHTLEVLTDQNQDWRMQQILSMDRALEHLPKLELNQVEIYAIQQGKNFEPALLEPNHIGIVRLYDVNANLIGLGEINANVLKAKRLVSIY